MGADGNTPNPHHILHKYPAGTAIAWPGPGDVLIGSLPLDRHPKTGRAPKGLRALRIFRR
jgi:hypothetical protein